MRILTGTVQRVSVRKSGGWGIAVITVANSKTRMTIVGRGVADLVEGEVVNAEGDDKTHDKYGKQFEVSNIEIVATTAHGGIAAVVQQFKGIGKTYAARLADTYNADNPSNPRKFLNELNGYMRGGDPVASWFMPAFVTIANITQTLGPKGMLSFFTWLKDTYAITEERLHPVTGKKMRGSKVIDFSAPITKAVERCLQRYAEDPYHVMTTKYSFREADAILLKRKVIEKHDPVRLTYAMEDLLTNRSDTLFPYDSVVSQANAEFGIELEPMGFAEDEVAAVLPANTRRLTINNVRYIANTRLLFAERTILDGLARLQESTTLTDMPAISNEELHVGLKIKLTQEQIDTVKRSACSPVAIITGGPGVGKTSAVRGLINVLQSANVGTIQLAAPTNKAARRLAQQTGMPATSIHKLLEAFPDRSQLGDLFGTGFNFGINGTNPLRNVTVILDESSMIDIRLFAAIMDGLGKGCRLIMLGDHRQLPPIREGNPLFDLLDRVPTSHLTKILRSNPGRMQLNQAAIRASKLNQLNHQTTPDWHFIECESDEIIMENTILQAVPLLEEKGPYGFQIITPRRANHKLSTYEINMKFRERAFMTTDKAFLPGDKGLCNTTIASAAMVNGDMFLVEEASDKSPVMTITKELVIAGEEEQQTVKRYEEGLDFGWAITVHKYQGCETDVIIFVVSSSFGGFVNRNMIYTALTRAKQKVIIIGDKQAFYEALQVEERERLTCLNLLTRQGLAHGISQRAVIDGTDEETEDADVEEDANVEMDEIPDDWS